MKYSTSHLEANLGSARLVVQPSDRRAALIFSLTSAAGVVWLSTLPGLLTEQGLCLPVGSLPFKLCRCEVGNLVQQPWYAIDDGNGSALFVVEVMD